MEPKHFATCDMRSHLNVMKSSILGQNAITKYVFFNIGLPPFLLNNVKKNAELVNRYILQPKRSVERCPFENEAFRL